ncbi:PepSY-associated TM helix domain-containing protein [Comamonas composti]|uniref:PepSY-associated TM helix domain-containing protein n=1 Tax=Comamonas composti TaxID=408558 RepID=UPI0003FA8EC7|nr:PepSY-associated TM helix domain-containing protein [Comamonas composti]
MARTHGVVSPMVWVYAAHRWAGAVAGWLLLVICLTGTLVVYKHAIKAWANPTLVSHPASLPGLSPDQALAHFQQHYPGATPRLLAFPADAYSIHSYSFSLPGQGLASGRAWLNPHTGEVHAGLPSDFADFVQRLHAGLWMGGVGRWIVGALGLLMLISLLSGLIFHWRRLGRDLFKLRLRASPRKAWADLHKAGAVWLLWFHLLIALTGAWLGLESLFGLRNPPPRTLMPGTLQALAQPLPPSAFLEQARASFAQLRPTHMNFSAYGQAASSVRVQGDLPGLALVQRGQSMVVMQAEDALAIDVVDRREQGLGARLLAMMRPLHYGYFGGKWMLLAYFLMGAVCSALVFSGLAVWSFRKADAQARRTPAQTAAPWMARVNAGMSLGLFITLLLSAHASQLRWTAWGSALPHGLDWLRFVGSHDLLGSAPVAVELIAFLLIWGLVALCLSLDKSTRRAWSAGWALTALLLLALPLTSAAASGGFAPDWQRGQQQARWIALSCWALAATCFMAAWQQHKKRNFH